ncbi:Transcriptional regulator, TetR family protein [Enhygromyxa salina]|uniref:Transcriptional regulator, TetR family protein n=1 Tax=Enhygromyxa salina TaxID=215803 RepID=A0A0C2D0L0_9BACT|nr:TetR/AcrR family transcriptional regulator [Enhygromyxa salina]KIG16761.1 Transcriptional regulator, TetR family protein [Enhygromyxa salina]
MRDQILDHAESQLLKYGYKAFRVDELARAAGISKRTLYEQFLTKEAIAQEALARRLERLAGAIERVSRRRPADPPAQLRECIALIWQADGEARPGFFRDLEATPALAELVAAFQRRGAAALERVIRSGIRQGQFRRGLDPSLVRRLLVAAVAQLTGEPRPNEDRPDPPEQTIDAILDLILHGVTAV